MNSAERNTRLCYCWTQAVMIYGGSVELVVDKVMNSLM